jgi:hypothetical protein
MYGQRSFENFDPHFCGAATKVAAAVCVLLLGITLVASFTIDLFCLRSRLPRLFASDHAATEFFKAFIFLQAGIAAGLTWISATWTTHAQRLADQLDAAKRDLLLQEPPIEKNYSLVLIIDLNKLIVLVLIAFVFGSSIPVIALAAACFA